MGALPRTIVYIDGFNLYYGVFKDQRCARYKWLDFDQYFRALIPNANIVAIKYFSALIDPNCTTRKGKRQATYWDALGTLTLTQIIPGRFKTKSVSCEFRACPLGAGPRIFQVPEEKRTDVNIALEILDDVQRGLSDDVVLVSGDSDLAPALQKVRSSFPKVRIALYVPAAFNPIRGKAAELRALAHKDRNFDTALLSRSQFPNPVLKADGTQIDKPLAWA
jgi:uncharacterized LabA/DUF88 family protein